MVSTRTGRIRIVLDMLMVGVLMGSMVTDIHGVMVHLGPCHCRGTLTTCARGRAQHGSRGRTPNGQQDGKQYEQPNANGFHSKVSVAQRAKSSSAKSNDRV